ncbi:MAG: ABC transporter ATP-binding protein [Lachnospiraceae bacterium]
MIEIKELVKIYGKGNGEKKALNGVTFSIEKGEYIAIMGTSGSGKSTLLNVIGGMDVLTSGEYYFDGIPVHELKGGKLDQFRKEHISFVFQQFALMNHYTVAENVELPLLCRKLSGKQRKRMVSEALDKMGIHPLKNKRVTKISGGEQQRCAIARAMVSDNELILADEPTGALDRKTGEEIMKCFTKMKEEGKTVIVVTHDENVASYADRIIRLEDGMIIS